jgi:hypothetical protein
MRSPRSVEHDRKEAASLRVSQKRLSEFARRMARVVHHDTEGVSEGRGRLVEGDPVLPFICSGLLGVPFEGESHCENYAFRDLLGMRLTPCASAASDSPAHALTNVPSLRTEWPPSTETGSDALVGCMRLLGSSPPQQIAALWLFTFEVCQSTRDTRQERAHPASDDHVEGLPKLEFPAIDLRVLR